MEFDGAARTPRERIGQASWGNGCRNEENTETQASWARSENGPKRGKKEKRTSRREKRREVKAMMCR
jgi:hypothetical protein